jgi:hypothetical protein
LCLGDKLGFISVKLCSDVCHISVICNSYMYCAWPMPVSYLRSANPQWMNMTPCDVVCFLLGNSLVSEFCMPTFQNTLFIPSS